MACENKISDNYSYKNIFTKLEEYQKYGFKNQITKEEISSDGKIEFDDFYMAAYNLILSKLKQKILKKVIFILIFIIMYVNHYIKIAKKKINY